MAVSDSLTADGGDDLRDVPPGFSVLEGNPDVRTDLEVIVVGVGQTRRQVIPRIDADFERLPHREFKSAAELHSEIEILGPIGRRADHMDVQPDRNDPRPEGAAFHEFDLRRHVDGHHRELHLLGIGRLLVHKKCV